MAALWGLAGPAGAADDAWDPIQLTGRGRPVQAVALPPGTNGTRDLLVVYVEGLPPGEARHLDVFRAADLAGAGPVAPARRILVPPDAVTFDVGDLHPAPGPEVIFVSAAALEIVSVSGPAGGTLRRLELAPPAPLPPRSREMSRMPFSGDWDGDGRPDGLLPAIAGLRLVRLDDGTQRTLSLPLRTEYYTPDPTPPPFDGILEVWLQWPRVVAGEDDGDGRPDLFALGRYDVSVFRTGPEGLPAEPTRRMPLRPFGREEELRWELTRLRLFARDLDGDGLTDLVAHRTFGTLVGAHASTELHRNPGTGADVGRPARSTLRVENGVSGLRVEDLDGDGRHELFQASVRFGVVQFVRFLATRRVEVLLSVHGSGGPDQPVELVWRREESLRLDLERGRTDGLLPEVGGDWNGDGRKDLIFGVSSREVAIHLGEATDAGPGFGDRTSVQTVPDASEHLVVDIDGDGLDDLVLWDELDESGTIHLLRNRGVLPGTAPSLR